MKTKLIKRVALLVALLMLAVCLPVSGMAATAVTTSWDVMSGYNFINLDYAIAICVEEINNMSFNDKTQKLTFALEKVGNGITVEDSQMNYADIEELEDGYSYTPPYVGLTVDSAEAHGESIVFTVQVKPENKTYRCEVELSIVALFKPVVSATAATELEEAEYGTYTMTAEEGSFITITPVYEDMNGKKLAMETEWYTYDYENGYSDLLSKQNTHTFEVTQALDGDDLEWQIYLPSIDYEASSWIHLTVVPQGTLTTGSSSAPEASVPSTGDNAAPMLWLAGMLMAGTGCAALMMKRRQNG